MSRIRSGLGSVLWIVTGLLFALYPILRPYHDETTLTGAAGMASARWLIAHTLGMLGFVGLTAGVWLLSEPVGLSSRRAARAVLVLSWLGSSLVLPYYGAEAFALRVIGARAVRDQDPSLLQLADAFRFGAVPITLFGTGLVLLAVAGVLLAVVLWRAAPKLRLAGLLTGTMLALYLPQFFGSPAVRIGHGLLLGLGCIGLGIALSQRSVRTVGISTTAGSEVQDVPLAAA